MNTRITGRLFRGRLYVAIVTAASLAAAPVSAGKPPPPPPPPPPVTFTAVDIGNLAGAIGGEVAAINEAGTIVGTAQLPNSVTTAFVLEPLPLAPSPYFPDDNGDGVNPLIEALQRLPSSEEFGSGNYATDINASGVIAGWQWGIGPVLWVKSDGAYGTPVALFDPSWVDRWDLGNVTNINDSRSSSAVSTSRRERGFHTSSCQRT